MLTKSHPPPEFTAAPRLRTSPSRKPYRRTPYFPLPTPSHALSMTPMPTIPTSAAGSMSPPAPRLEQNEFEPSPTLSSATFSPTLSSARYSPGSTFSSFDSVFSSPASSFTSSPSSSPSMSSSGFPSPTPASVDWGMGLGLGVVASPTDESATLAPTVYERGGGKARACAESTIHVCRLRLKGFEDMVMVAGEEARRSRVRGKERREKRRRDMFEDDV